MIACYYTFKRHPMSSLKHALERVLRVVQTPGAQNRVPAQKSYLPAAPEARLRPKTCQIQRSKLPDWEYARIMPKLGNVQRKKFQDFLEPLGIPQLKIYDDNVAKYDIGRAQQNLRQKRSAKPTDIFIDYLNEKAMFNKMLTWLVDLTPVHLKDGNVVQNVAALQNVLQEENDQFMATKYVNTPRYHFHEVPPMPNPLTPESFQEYIYFLTHSQIVYRNSVSLKSGIVPDILLHTHRLDNVAFQKCRSVETYNYLIKYFGNDKFQVSFAKELLLVMIKDGHVPNINTINTLIKICKRHSHRRAVTSTYFAVVRYLQLAKKFGIELNLTTWNRVYDCIQNVLLKEQFVNKISAENLPISANLAVQILEDYSTTTDSYLEVIRFVESDLRRSEWRADSRVCNKILHHRIRHLRDIGELRDIFDDMLPQLKTDIATVKAMVDAVEANPFVATKEALILGVFLRFSHGDIPPETFGKVVATMCRITTNYDVHGLSFIVRGLIHDACIAYQLPEEYLEYEDEGKGKHRVGAEKLPNWETKKGNKGKYGLAIPLHSVSESYRIVKRLSKDGLNDLEIRVLYGKQEHGAQNAMPHEKLSEAEVVTWQELKERARSEEFWGDPEVALGLTQAAYVTPASVVNAYKRANHESMGTSHKRNFVEMLHSGPHEHLMQEMRQRNIIDVNV